MTTIMPRGMRRLSHNSSPGGGPRSASNLDSWIRQQEAGVGGSHGSGHLQYNSPGHPQHSPGHPQHGAVHSGGAHTHGEHFPGTASAAADSSDQPPGERSWRHKIWECLDDPSSTRVVDCPTQPRVIGVCLRMSAFASFVFLNAQMGTCTAYWFSISVLSLILLSCTAFVVETIPSMCCGRYDDVWGQIESICVAVFTFEYLSRIIVVPTDSENEGFLKTTKLTGLKAEVFARFRFAIRPLNAVDFAAIFPFYLQLLPFSGDAGGTTSFLRVIRLARVFRLFKLSKYSQGMWLLSATMVRSWRALGMLGFFMLISVVLFSSVMYFVERGDYFYCTEEAFKLGLCLYEDIARPNRTEGVGLEKCEEWALDKYKFPLKCCWGEGWYVAEDANGDACVDKSQFESIVATAWWCVVTMTTVGYGDVFPLTTLGKVVATATMLSGILILALPITVIGSNFNLEYERTVQEEALKKELEMQREEAEALLGAGEEGAMPVKDEVGGMEPLETGRRASTEADVGRSTEVNQALLEKVERLMAEQREAILRRAHELIAQHVREIAKEVVAQSNAARLNGAGGRKHPAGGGAGGAGGGGGGGGGEASGPRREVKEGGTPAREGGGGAGREDAEVRDGTEAAASKGKVDKKEDLPGSITPEER